MLSAFESLKDAWEGRRKELEGRIGQVQVQMQYGYGNMQQEGMRLQGVSVGLASEYPNTNRPCFSLRGKLLQISVKMTSFRLSLHFLIFATDSTAASSFQMREVFQGYRQSGDLASKKRVRESCNAALSGLPDWPGPY
jgi:hypothetical protein